jgi:amino acid permease
VLQSSAAAFALYAGISHHFRVRGVGFGESGFLSSADTTREALFLHIPVARLIVMSIVSFGLYQAYWVYRNWRYVKERGDLGIRPFWRGVFCVFYCHSLLRRIHGDEEARAVQAPSFSPGALATAWVVLVVVANLVSRAPGTAATMVAAFVPSYLCLVPVQNYVNSVTERRSPGHPHHRWSSGHAVCLFVGLAVWALLLVGRGPG